MWQVSIYTCLVKYTLIIQDIVWAFMVYCPLLFMWGVGYGVREGRSRFTVLGTGAKVQNSKSLKRKKLVTHLLKRIVAITLIYLLSAERIPVLMGDIMTR